jgi:uncharacterized repeat protein (TIGR01451 family)
VDLLYLNATGTGLVSSTYLGGAGFNGSTTTSLAVSPQGNIYIAGFTAAVNVMTTPNAFQPQYSNSATGGPCPLECNNGFVIEVNSTGAQVVYGTYFGPRYSDTKVNSIAIATDGSVYFSGYTNTTTIQATAGAFLTKPDYGFVAKLTPGSSVMDSFSYLPNYFSPFLEVGNQPEAAYVVFWTPSVGPTQGIEVAELNVPTLALTSSLNLTIPFPGFAAFAAAFAPPHSLWLAGFCESPCSLGNLVSSNAFQNTPQNPSSSAVLIRVTDLPSVPQLTVGVSHIGNFTQGQSGAAYTITVQNTGGGASTGIVTVTDALPAGLTAATMGGVGWSCVVSSATCTRLDSLSAVSAYPAITLTLNVALGTASPVVNQVNVTGSGSAAASATDSTTILAPFADVSPTDAFLPAINLLREYSITSGCDNSPLQPKYCPTDNITRGQMAVFVVRSITGGDNFSYTQAPYFTDVPSSHPFFQWIQKLRDLGVTSSCGSTPAGQLYCPNDPVTRGQMAVFIIRDRFGSATVFNYSPTPLFTDVLPANTFFAWIQKLKQLGITSSCGSNAAGQQYCPDDPVTREQMAVFLMRGAFNQLLLAGAPVIVSVSPAAEPRGYSTTVTLTGQNTNWVNGTTQVSTGPGITASNVLVTSPTTLTAQLVVAASAVAGPYSLTAITGSEEATLPNGFTVQ